MRLVLRAGITAGLGFAYLVLLVAAVVPLPILFLLAAVAVVVAELVLSRRAPYVLPQALSTGLDVRFRLLSVDVLTALLAARLLPDAGRIVALASVAVRAKNGAKSSERTHAPDQPAVAAGPTKPPTVWIGCY